MPRQTKTNIYCGIKKVAPKGKKLGNMDECAKIGQLRRWGMKRVPKELMEMMLEVAGRKKIMASEKKELEKLLKQSKKQPKQPKQPKQKTKVYKPFVEKRKLKMDKRYTTQSGRVEAPLFKLNLKSIMQPENVPLPLSPKPKPAKSKVEKKKEEYEMLFNHANVDLLLPFYKNKTALKSALVGRTNKQQILKGFITTLNKAKTTKAVENFMNKHQL